MSEFPIKSIVELGRLCLQFGRVNRVTYHEDGKRFETDTDHTVMLGILAGAFAARFAPYLNEGLIAQFALVHDFVEVYAGDTCTLGITPSQSASKAEREARALSLLTERFATTLPWLPSTIARYESLNTPEARFVKVLDKVLPKITHALNRGAALLEHNVKTLDQLDEINAKQRRDIAESYGWDQAPALRLLSEIHDELCESLAAAGYAPSAEPLP